MNRAVQVFSTHHLQPPSKLITKLSIKKKNLFKNKWLFKSFFNQTYQNMLLIASKIWLFLATCSWCPGYLKFVLNMNINIATRWSWWANVLQNASWKNIQFVNQNMQKRFTYKEKCFPICCPKGIYVTRITPKGPADIAGLRMGDKILQVCKNDPQDGALCTGSRASWSVPTFLFLPPRWTAGIWPWWPMTRLVKDSQRRGKTLCGYW